MAESGPEKRLQIVSKDLKKSNRELAKLLGISPASLDRMKAGKQELNFKALSALVS